MSKTLMVGTGFSGVGRISLLGCKRLNNISQLIKSLFANNEQGFAYDPNDLTTMYQDATGTVPVTGAGQPVGLVLDKSKGIALGEELFLNSEFNSQDGWNLSPNVSINNGALKFTEASAARARYTVNTKAATWYLFSIDIASNPSGLLGLRVGGVLLTGYVSKTGRLHVFYLSATAGVIDFDIVCSTLATTAEINSASLKEIKGNHAYQTTSASRPILRQNVTTGAYYLEFDGTDDFLQTAVSLPFPVTAVAPFDFKSKDTIKCILSAGATGYLRSTETAASVHSTSGSVSIAKKKVDVLLHELTGDSVNIRTNVDGIMISNIDIPAKNSYLALNKYIGSFSNTHTALRAAMDLYGMVAIRKLLTTSEEAEIRAHFNKRMGI